MSKLNLIFTGIYAVFILISAFLDINLLFLCALTMWVINVAYCLGRFQHRILFLMFEISFFVFLLGGHFVYEYFGMEIKYYLSDELYNHSNFCLFLSQLCLFIGYYCCSRIKLVVYKKNKKPVKERVSSYKNSRYVQAVRQTSRLLFYVTFPFWIYTILDVASFVFNNTYVSYYVDYESNAPFIVRSIAALTPYFFYVFLATLPSKKQCKWPIVLYLVYAFVSLLSGRRIYFMVMIMFVVLYAVLRNKRDGEVWLTKRLIVTGLILVPVLIISLYGISYVRSGAALSGSSLKDIFLGFFQQQGFSSSIIRLEKFYEDALRDDAYYSLFGIVKYFRTNTILKTIFDPQYDFSYLHNSAAFATKGNSFSNALSYLVLSSYLDGAGLGTTYIAELYHDFGYAGIVGGNLIYGIVLAVLSKVFSKARQYNVWVIAIALTMVESFLKAPRWNFDIFVSYFLDLGMWSAFLLVFVAVYIITFNKSKKSNEIWQNQKNHQEQPV